MVKNFVSTLATKGYERPDENATGVYKTINGVTIRISDHQANAATFHDDKTPDNLSIVLEKPKTNYFFKADTGGLSLKLYTFVTICNYILNLLK